MEKISGLGRGVMELVGQTYEAYSPLLRRNAAQIHRTKVTTYSYGPDERHKLDHYEPGPNTPSPIQGERPVLVYVYGGAFAVGDRILTDLPESTVYANIGSFFADRLGYNVVIIDYRLVKHGARYPSGGEDLSLALDWVAQHFSRPRSLFLMGNSAGGSHIATWLFDPAFQKSTEPFLKDSANLKLRGVVFLSTPLTVSPDEERMFEPYYGDVAVSRGVLPTTLMKKKIANQNAASKHQSWPDFLILVAELDPESLRVAADDFSRAWHEGGGKNTETKLLKGHNHLSPPLSLGTNIEEEEAWGYLTGEWMAAVAARVPKSKDRSE